MKPPVVKVIVDFDCPLASAKRLDSRAVRRDEVRPGWTGPVLARGRYDANFCSSVD